MSNKIVKKLKLSCIKTYHSNFHETVHYKARSRPHSSVFKNKQTNKKMRYQGLSFEGCFYVTVNEKTYSNLILC